MHYLVRIYFSCQAVVLGLNAEFHLVAGVIGKSDVVASLGRATTAAACLLCPAEIDAVDRLYLELGRVGRKRRCAFLLAHILIKTEQEVAALEIGVRIKALRHFDARESELPFMPIGFRAKRSIAVGDGLGIHIRILPRIDERDAIVAAPIGEEFRGGFCHHRRFADFRDGNRLWTRWFCHGHCDRSNTPTGGFDTAAGGFGLLVQADAAMTAPSVASKMTS